MFDHFVGLALKGVKISRKTSVIKTLTFSKLALLLSRDCALFKVALFKVTFLLLSFAGFLLAAATLDVKALLLGKGGNVTFTLPVLSGLSRLVVEKKKQQQKTDSGLIFNSK